MSYTLFNGLWITEHRKGGKMENKDSVMFAHTDFCKSRHSGVCQKCYSKRLSGYRPNLQRVQEHNTRIMSDPTFQPCKMNAIDNTLRWVSMGEIDNDQMFRNICRQSEANDHIGFQIWTKQADIVHRNAGFIPSNLTLVWSATKINVAKPFVPSGWDIGFFVYSDVNLIPAEAFHCQKKCSDCGFCYRPGASGIVAEVVR